MSGEHLQGGVMEGSVAARSTIPADQPNATSVLVLAYRTAATPTLVEKVRERAARGPCSFTLLVPRPGRHSDPEGDAAEHTLELALPLLEEAAGGHVEGVLGDSDPYVAVRDLLKSRRFDEVIVSTLPERVSRWLRRDVPSQIRSLGVTVTVVTAPQAARRVWPSDAPPHGFGA
jgi:hypothetical protein